MCTFGIGGRKGCDTSIKMTKHKRSIKTAHRLARAPVHFSSHHEEEMTDLALFQIFQKRKTEKTTDAIKR